MTQEDKELLLKDLCMRLPYGVNAICDVSSFELFDELRENNGRKCFIDINSIHGDKVEFWDEEGYLDWWMPLCYIRPYLRPMSSMTEEELKELNEKYGNIAYFFIQEPPYYHGLQAQHSDIGSVEISEFSTIYDWLNAHHFDYRGLIEKGLALEVPEGMYKD